MSAKRSTAHPSQHAVTRVRMLPFPLQTKSPTLTPPHPQGWGLHVWGDTPDGTQWQQPLKPTRWGQGQGQGAAERGQQPELRALWGRGTFGDWGRRGPCPDADALRGQEGLCIPAARCAPRLVGRAVVAGRWREGAGEATAGRAVGWHVP